MSAPETGEIITKLQQDDLKFVLASDEVFNNVTIVTEDDGDIEAMMSKALGVFTIKDGGCGVCVIIQQPSGSDQDPGIRSPGLMLDWTLLVLENRLVNKDTAQGGTGKKAWYLARRIVRILKNHRAGGLTMNFSPGQPTIVPLPFGVSVGDRTIPLVAYEVRFRGKEADTTRYTWVANPTISATSISMETGTQVGTAGDTVTLACATADAQIYYTTDLSHPCSQNEAATLYQGPFTVPACTLRVRAHKSGLIGSDTTMAVFN